MSKYAKAAALVVIFAGLATARAGATTGPAMLQSRSPIGTASNTGAISGNSSSYGTQVFTFSSVQVRCVDVTFRITSVTTASATLNPSYSGCVLFAGANFAATVTSECCWGWVETLGSFVNTTGHVAGAIFRHATIHASIPSLGCTITKFPADSPGLSSQNITQSGAFDTSASPWGAAITANVTGLTYTATPEPGGTCAGIAEHGGGTHSGTVAVRNVWNSL